MLRTQPLPPVPEETAWVARAARSPTHPYAKLADELGELFCDERFADLFPRMVDRRAQWQLVLATILRLAEGLSDRQAASPPAAASIDSTSSDWSTASSRGDYWRTTRPRACS